MALFVPGGVEPQSEQIETLLLGPGEPQSGQDEAALILLLGSGEVEPQSGQCEEASTLLLSPGVVETVLLPGQLEQKVAAPVVVGCAEALVDRDVVGPDPPVGRAVVVSAPQAV